MNDLDMIDSVNWNGGTGYKPFEFYGHFDGDMHIVSNLHCAQYYSTAALFEKFYGSVKNLILDKADFTCSYDSGVSYVAGICRELYPGNGFTSLEKVEIKNSSFSYTAGGYAGSRTYMGGLVAFTRLLYADYDFNIIECASVNNIFTSNQVYDNNFAGIINMDYGSQGTNKLIIEDCYALDNTFSVLNSVDGRNVFAGIVIADEYDLSISRCYTSNLTASMYAGVYYADPIVFPVTTPTSLVEIDCYYNLTNNVGFVWSTPVYGTELTVAEMQDSGNFNNWDSVNVWGWDSNINYGYPHLLAFIIITKPTINIISYTLDKISDEVGYQTSVVTFQSNQDLIEWEARADGTGHGSGLLVGSGTNITANTDVIFDVDYTELTQGDKTYQINVYGKNSNNEWSDS